MPLITFRPSCKMIDVPAGTGLVDAAREAGVSIEAPCGGEGICGKCQVRVVAGEVYFDNPSATPFIPNWRRVYDAWPDVFRDMAAAVEADNRDG